MDINQVWTQSLTDAENCLQQFLNRSDNIDLCAKFSTMLIETINSGGTVFACGNGGSHCDAMHFAEELTGRYRKDRRPLGALALGDPSHVTCVSNDYGFEHIFSRQLEGLGRKGDMVIGLSTSGNSANIINTFVVAKSVGVRTVALLGRDGADSGPWQIWPLSCQERPRIAFKNCT